ncbi:hypothetical protein NL529_29585, partial [Klebsiella pneumoniae]|nr:hypothetical protein [Klebsiella pneumoniae]
GFLAVAMFAPDPQRDLPILECFDQYRQVESADFLRMLYQEKLFTEDLDDVPSVTVPEKDELIRHQEQFQMLNAGEQQRIHQLHQQLE